MLPEWGQVGFLLLLALIFPIGGIGASWLLGRVGLRPEHPDRIKEDTYECGVETEGPTWVQFNFRYYFSRSLRDFDISGLPGRCPLSGWQSPASSRSYVCWHLLIGLLYALAQERPGVERPMTTFRA
jgi:hypothetical protein